jgi:hypothetical protein
MGLRRRLAGLVSLARHAEATALVNNLSEFHMLTSDVPSTSIRCSLRGSPAPRHQQLTRTSEASTLALERAQPLQRSFQTRATWRTTQAKAQAHVAALYR